MATRRNAVSRIEKALRAKVGDRATELMHRRSRHLADLTPHEIAQGSGGERIVLAELHNIVLQVGEAG